MVDSEECFAFVLRFFDLVKGGEGFKTMEGVYC